MAVRKTTTEEWGDVIADAVRELEGAASLLEQKQPGRHSERAVTTMRFETAQLAAILPQIRQARQDEVDPHAPRVSVDVRRMGGQQDARGIGHVLAAPSAASGQHPQDA